MRRNDGCINCGEVRDMAAHGLCFKCYRQAERAADRQVASADRHTPGIRRDHKKLFRGFNGVMAGLSDLGVSQNDVLAIRQIVDPYLTPIAKFLALVPKQEKPETNVNGEHDSQKRFTVHAGQAINGTGSGTQVTGAPDGK